MTIKEIQDSIVEEFSMFDDWMDRYSMLIEMGKDCPIIDAQYRNDNYLINGFIRKKAVYFLAPFNKEDIRMNIMEISEYRLVTFDEAMTFLNFKHDRDILTKANEFIDSITKDS